MNLLYQHNKIAKTLYNNFIIRIITELKTIHFGLLKDFGNNLKHEIDFIIKNNEYLAEYIIKNKIFKLLYEYKH